MKRRITLFSLQNRNHQLLQPLFFISLLLLFSLQAKAQSGRMTIQGVITSASDNLPLIGVNVVEKGTTNGTITDFDGNFELTVSPGVTLTASYIGYLEEEVKVIQGNTFYQVVMKENSLALDEVVVVGYGVQKKKLVTGATVQVKGDDIRKLNTVSPLSALQSQIPGVNIVKKSGQPGEGFKVNIRGIGTIGNSQPLYIVDGVARGDIDYLNPADIESLDVLKDAASAAIYGSRAANGVVLVTTKQGKAGKASIEYDGYFGVQNPYKMTPVLNAQEYVIIMNEAKVNSGLPLNDYASLLAPGDWERIQNGTWQGTNWLEEIRKKNAPVQSHSLNMSGGTEQSVYSIGLSYTSQEGIFGKPVTPEYTRYTARVNTEHTLYKVKDLNVIQFGENLSYTYAEKNGIAIGDGYWNDINSALRTTPFLPLWARDADGNDIPGQYHYVIPWNTQMPNPVGVMDYGRGQNASKNHNIYGNFYFVIQPIKDLKFRSNFGFNASAWSYRAYKPEFDLGPVDMNPEDEIRQNSGNGLGWTFENTLSYTFKINTDHTFDALIGTSAERWGLGESVSGKNVNSVFGDFNHAFLDNTALLDIAKMELGGKLGDRGGILSYFGRINYNYQEKYMGTVVFRADGSSNFAKGNRWGYFPSVSAGWVMSNEEFMETTREWMDFLKLRASWGQNGNQSIDAFQYLATISFKDSEYFIGAKDNKVVGAYPDILPNPDVTWETSEQIDLGIDARFLNSRLSLAFDWYKKTTRDWLVPAPILASYGTGAPYINGGDIVNKGIELSLNWNDRVEDFTYSVTANLSHNKNEITRIANNEGIIRSEVNLNYGEEGFPRAQVGYPISYFWGYKNRWYFPESRRDPKL